jgi:hypothetical protein
MSPQKAYVLKTWVPAGGAILGGSENFSRWGLARGSRSLEWVLGSVLSLASFLSLYLLPGHHEVKKVPPSPVPVTVMFCPRA